VVGASVVAGGLTWSRPAVAADPFLGQIQYFAFNFAPRTWSFCNGQILPIAQNTALFSLFGTIYGGDGRTSFALPDMRGRSPVHWGHGAGLSTRRIGERNGAEEVVLGVSELPSHTHALMATSNRGDQTDPTGAVLSRDGRDETYRAEAPNTNMHADSILAAGAGQAHENMAPYLAVNCNVALQGTYPSRN
jgi:microcystin-dependent protein